MNREDVKKKVIQTIHQCAPELEGVSMDENSIVNTDIGVDSMEFIYIISKLEGQFSMRIPEEEWENISTLGELVDAVMKYANNASVPSESSNDSSKS